MTDSPQVRVATQGRVRHVPPDERSMCECNRAVYSKRGRSGDESCQEHMRRGLPVQAMEEWLCDGSRVRVSTPSLGVFNDGSELRGGLRSGGHR
jgi:hypothetical protein